MIIIWVKSFKKKQLKLITKVNLYTSWSKLTWIKTPPVNKIRQQLEFMRPKSPRKIITIRKTKLIQVKPFKIIHQEMNRNLDNNHFLYTRTRQRKRNGKVFQGFKENIDQLNDNCT